MTLFRALGALLITGCLIQSAEAQMFRDSDIPIREAADSVMAAPADTREMRNWAAAAFAGRPAPGALPLEVRRQDHSVLRFGRSCIDTPIRIGRRSFRYGLGTHAVSEIAVALPTDAKTFEAFVGVDNNDNTGGSRGSVCFGVEIDGRERFRTPVLRGGQEPVAVRVEIPQGAREMVLKVSDGGDGAGFDQADWADARLILSGGRTKRLDDGQLDTLLLGTDPPFSFTYGGAPSDRLLHSWTRTALAREEPDHTAYTTRWVDPQTGLQITAEARAFKGYAAVDWVLSFENRGGRDTPVLEDIQALDTRLRTGYVRTPVALRQLHGDSCNASSFQPFDTTLEPGKGLRMAPTGGRPSSETAFPWFGLQYAEMGLIAAVGWTGQWAASLDRAPTGPTRLRAGMERTHLVLHPGERIRTPRILLLAWKGDRLRAHAQLRRLVLYHFVPKQNGRPVRMPLAMQDFDRYVGRPDWATEAGQLRCADAAKAAGMDTLWLDAAWFPGGFPNGVGNWRCDPSRFPHGLNPVSDRCHALGMKFVLWFEPERVAAGSEIAREHAEFVHGGAAGGLFKLDDPEARRWMTDRLSRLIEENGVDVYRNDFNMDPLDFWCRADSPDRQGMTEIRYVEGLYAMWDELRRRHPGLMIDNCSGGGRRLDLEMCSRSVPLWRSDTGCSPGHPEWNQMQSAALGLYLPLFNVGLWSHVPYETRSAGTAGANCEVAYLDSGYSVSQARAAIREIDANRKFWYGDLYPLTPIGAGSDQFAAWQLHRADLDSGLVLAFRRPDCGFVGLILGLRAIDPARSYAVTFVDETRKSRTEAMSGRELAAGLALRISRPGSSLLVRYEPAPARRR